MTWNWTPPPQPTTLTGRFASITKTLTDGLYACTGALLTRDMYEVLNAWVFRHVIRIRLLIAALQEGTVRSRKSPVPGLTRRKAEREAAAPAWVVPRNFAWLRIILSTYGKNILIPSGPLEHLLTDPELMALLAASPRLVRTMRPLCRALGVQMPTFPKPVPPAAAKPGLEVGAEPAALPGAADVRLPARDARGGSARGEVARFVAGDARFRK